MTNFRSLALASILTGTSAFSLSKLGEHRNAVELNVIRNRRDAIFTAASAVVGAGVLLDPTPASARLEAVNRPDLLPTEAGKNVIQVRFSLFAIQLLQRMRKQESIIPLTCIFFWLCGLRTQIFLETS